MSASVGTLGQLGIHTANPVTKRFDYVDEDCVVDEDFLNANGLRGTRSHDISRVRQNLRRVGGPINLQPNAVEWALLLPWIMCGTTSGSPTVTYNLGEAATTRYITIDRIIKVFTYSGCAVDVATITGNQGEALKLALQIVGQDESVGAAGSFPSLSIDTANGPFIFSDLVLSVNATTVQAKTFELVINNMIDKDRFFNSLTLTDLVMLDREVTLRTSIPYGDYSALYNTGSGGVAWSATFTNGSAVLTISGPKVALPRKSPPTPGRVEIMLPLEGRCYKSSGTNEVTITLNPGP